MIKEFKKFILTGNVVDLAVAVILAGAVGLVVKGFVSMIMMPIVGHYAGGVDFSDLKIVLDAAILNPEGAIVTAENAIKYGEWMNTIVNLLIVGGVLFVIVRAYGKIRKKEEEAPKSPPTPSKEELLLTEIRDLLKK